MEQFQWVNMLTGYVPLRRDLAWLSSSMPVCPLYKGGCSLRPRLQAAGMPPQLQCACSTMFARSSRFCDARQLVEMSMGCCSLALCMSGTGINYCVRGTFDKYCLFCLVSGAVCASCFKWSKSVISKADVMVHKLHLEQLHWWHLHYWSGSRLYCSRLIFVMWVISCIQNCVYLFVCDCPSCIALILLALLFCFCMLPYHFASTMLRLIPAQSS